MGRLLSKANPTFVVLRTDSGPHGIVRQHLPSGLD
jgi:hypothetical protein